MLDLLLWPFAAGLVLTASTPVSDCTCSRAASSSSISRLRKWRRSASPSPSSPATRCRAKPPTGTPSPSPSAARCCLRSRALRSSIQQEAVIGIVYAVSASLCVLALDRAPQGAEHIKQLLIGSILTVTPQEVGVVAVLYAADRRRTLCGAPRAPRGVLRSAARRRGRPSFVPVGRCLLRLLRAGRHLVRAYRGSAPRLRLSHRSGRHRQPFDTRRGSRLLLAWALGAALTAAGLYASWAWDLPTGPAIVTAFGTATALVGLGFALKKTLLAHAGQVAARRVALAGVLLLAFPRMDQPWLDALERMAPPTQTAFLTEFERATRIDMLESIERSQRELARLRELEQDVRWGKQRWRRRRSSVCVSTSPAAARFPRANNSSYAICAARHGIGSDYCSAFRCSSSASVACTCFRRSPVLL